MSSDCDVCGEDWQGDHKICVLVDELKKTNHELRELGKTLFALASTFAHVNERSHYFAECFSEDEDE